jgi:hypothetical protein
MAKLAKQNVPQKTKEKKVQSRNVQMNWTKNWLLSRGSKKFFRLEATVGTLYLLTYLLYLVLA